MSRFFWVANVLFRLSCNSPMLFVYALIYNANLRLPPGKRKSQNQLAKELGLAKSTFSREINRGRCYNPTCFAVRTIWEYSEHKAQRLVRKGSLGAVRSITTDNGGEFAKHEELRKALRRTNRFLKIYYTHAYAAWEKGSVENVNRHIR